jgi:hypothetical protein
VGREVVVKVEGCGIAARVEDEDCGRFGHFGWWW